LGRFPTLLDAYRQRLLNIAKDCKFDVLVFYFFLSFFLSFFLPSLFFVDDGNLFFFAEQVALAYSLLTREMKEMKIIKTDK